MPQEFMLVRHQGAAIAAAWFLAVYAVYVKGLVARRLRVADTDIRLGWWVGGALTVGTGLWAQSFVSLLSRQLPIHVGYVPAVILASWLPAVAVCGLVIWLVGQERAVLRWRLLGCGTCAVGFCFVTYLNVSSVLLSPSVQWDAGWMAASVSVVLLGCGAGSVLMRRELAREPRLGAQLLVALVLGSFLSLGQAMMLEAAKVPAAAVCLSRDQLSGAYLELLLTATVLMIFVLVQLGAWLDARWRRRQLQLEDSLRSAKHELAHVVQRDVLTGLLNRQGFEQHLREMLQEPQDADGHRVVMRINLDGFRALVNTYGHALGDALLRQVAQHLLVLVRNTDVPARAEGEEFLLLLQGMPDQHAVAQLAQRITAAIAQPTLIQGEEIRVTCSIGIAMTPDSGTVEQLMRHANEAMLTASKAGGGVYCLHEPGMDQTGAQQVALQRDLRHAIGRGELALHFQPKLDAVGGQLAGVEALLRWTHPQRGAVSPGEFIPVAERFGLIGELGQWVLDEACRHMRRWLDAGLRVPVAVNLSAHQLREHDLELRVREALARHDVPPSMLIMEITESVAMDDIKASLRVFDVLCGIGVKLSIDDFGTGYSSLSYLRRLSANQLKIDRSFVRDLEHSRDAQAIVEAVVRLAHALGLTVVAEGVETAAQRDVLVSLGCDELQGFLLGRPMPEAALHEWLGRHSAMLAHVPAVPA